MVYRAPNDQDEGDFLTGTRVCRECATRKPMAEYHWGPRRSCRRRICKQCTYARSAVVRSEKPEQYKEAARWRTRRRKYGLSKAQFDELWSAQAGACGICSRGLDVDATHVDHDHVTGSVRGLLCFTCNMAIGKFGDSIPVLRAAIDYLLRSERAVA